MQSGRHGQQLAKSDVGLLWIIKWEGFREVLFSENLGIETFGEKVMLLVEHDAAGDAGQRLAARRHRWDRFAIAASVIFLIDQPAVPRDEQSPMLARA